MHDVAAFRQDVASAPMQKVAAEFGGIADVVFMTTEEIKARAMQISKRLDGKDAVITGAGRRAGLSGHASVDSYMASMRARIPLGRTGVPADIAAAVAFLCSDDAAYITTESMNVSGGEEPH